MIFVLFTFGGWNEMAYVAAEVKNPRRNIWRALILGTVVVTAVYLLVNCAYLKALGFEAMGKSSAVAADTVSTAFPNYGKNPHQRLGLRLRARGRERIWYSRARGFHMP